MHISAETKRQREKSASWKARNGNGHEKHSEEGQLWEEGWARNNELNHQPQSQDANRWINQETAISECYLEMQKLRGLQVGASGVCVISLLAVKLILEQHWVLGALTP